MIKRTSIRSRAGVEVELESTIKELLSKSIAAEGIIDVFALREKEKPDISILDEKFLEEVRKIKYKNLAIEVLKKLLNDEINLRMRKNAIRYKSLLELLEKIIEEYEGRVISTSKVIERLIELAKEIKKVDKKADLERLRKQETPIQQVVKSIVEQMVHSILQREKSENLNDSRFCYREIFQVTLDTRQMSKLELILNKIRREDLSSLDLNGQNYLQLVSLFEQTSFLIRIKTKSLKDGRPLSPSEKEKFQEEIELLTLINQAIIKKQQDLLMDELFAN